MSTPDTSPTPSLAAGAPKESVKDTLISVIIAFVLAFVFRGFVVEAFVIPTGSMAPTLLGQHIRFNAEASGMPWTVGPWNTFPGTMDPKPVQGQASVGDPAVLVHDPRSGQAYERRDVPRLAGDRILVLKYLYALNEPRRFDVVVFKNPGDPTVNYIKRLIGLPGEQLALVDGDVFVRKAGANDADPANTPITWQEPGWTIARKPDDAARAMWQPVFDSAFAPSNPKGPDGQTWFNPPWRAGGAGGSGWKIENRRSYEYSGADAATLEWDSSRTFYTKPGAPERWEINDRYAYNENPFMAGSFHYPVSDIRLKAGVEPSSGGAGAITVMPTIETRGHQFRGIIEAGTARVQMRPFSAQTGPDSDWATLAEGRCTVFKPGVVTNVEFWHLDQRLELWVDGSLAASGNYNWTPAQRIAFATGQSLEQIASSNPNASMQLVDARLYSKPRVRWEFSGGAFALHRVGLDRDLHYRPARRNVSGQPAWGTHPTTTMRLNGDQFFVCGDNSPASEDGRLWERPDEWVAAEIDPTVGVVPRNLMLGKAFFVYFPALAGSSPIPMPDFGRLRWIR
ncbi:MAG: signal peptidase I [Phycisphaerales bacterium]